MTAGISHVRAMLLTLVAAAMTMPSAVAQTTPKIETLFPAGAQRGTKVEVQLIGDFMPGVCQLSAAGTGLTVKPADEKDRYVFAAAADAAAGPREIRLSSVQGASPPYPFQIGELPEVVHADGREPLELKLPVTANGRLQKTGDIDEYALTLTAGTQIVCAATTRKIRSPVDPMLRLLDANGKVVASSLPHRSADALLVFRAPTAGRYVLQVFDFQMAGGAEHIYRLTVTAGPWLDYAFPAGLQRDVECAVTLHGWNLPSSPDGKSVQRVSPQSTKRYELTLPECSNRLRLPVDEAPEVLETEPNDAVEQAQALAFPSTVNGRLQAPGDVDRFAFTAAKKDRFAFTVDSAELGFPTDIMLSIVDETGKSLVEGDDAKTSRDPSIRFIAPLDGRYFVLVRDRSRSGGEECIYRLRFSAPQPDVTVRVNGSSLAAPSGQTTNLAVVVERLDGFAEDLEVTALDLPAGVSVKPQPVPAKTPATIQLPLTVDAKLGPLTGLVRVVVRETKSTEKRERFAVIAESATAAAGSGVLWLAVGPEIPFTLKVGTRILDAPRMAAFPFPVTVVRKEGFTGPIRLVGVEPDRRGTVVPLTGEIAAGSDVGSLPLVIQNKVTEGTTHRCRVMGIADVQAADGKTYPVFHIAAGNMSMGCQPSLLTLQVEPSIVTWRPGETQRLEVKLMRYATLEPIKLTLVPPAGSVGIECDPVEVGPNEDRAVLNVRFAPEAVLPPRTTIEIRAETSRAGLPVYGTAGVRFESP